jgi:hypothetical protein
MAIIIFRRILNTRRNHPDRRSLSWPIYAAKRGMPTLLLSLILSARCDELVLYNQMKFRCWFDSDTISPFVLIHSLRTAMFFAIVTFNAQGPNCHQLPFIWGPAPALTRECSFRVVGASTPVLKTPTHRASVRTTYDRRARTRQWQLPAGPAAAAAAAAG